MPPVGAFIATTIGSALFSAGASVAVVNGAIALGSTLGSIALSAGLTFVASLFNRPKQVKPSDGQQETRQGVPERMFHYGRVKVSGPYGFFESGGAVAYRLILLSSRQIDAYEVFYLDNNRQTIDGGAVVSAPYVDEDGFPRVVIRTYLGTVGQTVDPSLSAAFEGWDANHRLRGTAYVIVECSTPEPEAFQAVFPNGLPEFAALIRGARVYDPRKDSTLPGGAGTHNPTVPDSWEWSENAGLAILDFLIFEDGYNIAPSKIDLASFQAFADLCDQPVLNADGDMVARYRIATTVRLSEARKVVLQRLLEACDATLYPTTDGKTAIRGGAYGAPTVTIDADAGHIIEANFAPPDALDRYNELAIQYLEPALEYVENEGQPWIDEADYAATGKSNTQSIDLYQVVGHSQARRLAKIRMARDNAEWTAELVTNLAGLSCIGERVIRLVWPELGIDGPFWIEGGVELSADMTTVSIKLRSADPSAYDWTVAEEGEPTVVPLSTSPDYDLTPPRFEVFEITGPALGAYWRKKTNQRGYQAEYRAGTSTAYAQMTTSDTKNSAVSPVVGATGTYGVHLRAGNGLQAQGKQSPDRGATLGVSNLLSSPLDMSGWTPSGVTRFVVGNQPAPNNDLLLDLILEQATSGEHALSRTQAATLSSAIFFSVYIRPQTITAGRIRLAASGTPTRFVDLAFDLAAMTSTLTTGGGASAPGKLLEPVISSYARDPVTDTITETVEFYRVGLGAILGGADTSVVATISTGAAPHLGVATSGLFLWGTKLEAGAAATTLRIN